MVYTSYNDMVNSLRRNLWKVPADIDLIVGVPRSGMIPALMLAELLNKRCTDLDSFIGDHIMSCGGRGRFIGRGTPNKVLILDDTVFSGRSMLRVREKLGHLHSRYNFIFGCVYAEGRDAKRMVDLYFEDNYREGETLWLYEWNILHHYEGNSIRFMFDIDGLLCKEPPDERNTREYESYLPNAVPMIVPTTKVGAIVTYRLDKYREVTEEWLSRHGINYGQLIMYNAADYEARKAKEIPALYKSRIYMGASWAVLFLESNAGQAEEIHSVTKKPVFCYENGRMYK